MYILQSSPVIEKAIRKRFRRENYSEKLQQYTGKLIEKRPSRQAKTDVEGLRSIGAGIYASNVKIFAQKATERMARTRALAELEDNAFPVAPKGRQGTVPKKRTPSSTPKDDSSENDESSDNDDGDSERGRRDPELDAKHMRLLMAMGHNIGQQAAHGPM